MLKCPIIPSKTSYEIVSEGPIAIWFYGKREAETDCYAFQVVREVVPMLLTTFNHQTSIVAQSSIPIYISQNTNIVVNGKGVQLYLGKDCRMIKNGKLGSLTISNEQFEIPKSHIIIIHCADVKKQFHDVIQQLFDQENCQVIVTDGMIAYCAGKNRIQLNFSDTKITILG